MIVKKKLKFVILGRIAYTDHFVKELNKYGFSKPLVIVSPDDEYIRDKKLLAPYGLDSDLEGLADLGLCDLHKIQSINSEDAMS